MLRKKGNWINEPLNIAMAVFGLVIIILIYTKINDAVQISSSWTTEAKNVMSGGLNNMTTAFNYSFILLIIISVIVMIIIANKRNFGIGEKILFAFSFVFVVFLLLIPAEVYDQAKQSNSDFLGVTQQLSIIDYGMSHILQIGITMLGVVAYFIFTSKSDDTT